jgi:hypothetical protein
MDYQRLPSCDAHATLDDLMLHYGQTSPRSMPPDVMVTMARHIDEDDVGRKRENRRLMVLILSALVVLIGVSNTTVGTMPDQADCRLDIIRRRLGPAREPAPPTEARRMLSRLGRTAGSRHRPAGTRS